MPVLAHDGRRARQGCGHRHVLHVRRPHRRHRGGGSCSCRRGVDHRPGRSDHAEPPASGSTDARPARRTIAGKTDLLGARGRSWRLLRATGDLDGEPTPTQRKANFYEKGDKPLEIVSTRQWYIRNGGRDEDAAAGDARARGDELAWVPAAHALPLRQLGQRAERRLAGLAAAVLRRAVPGLVPPRRRRRARLRRTRSLPPRTTPPGRPVATCRRLTTDQRGVPGGFIADPDVMDTWAIVLADPADRLRLGVATRRCSRVTFPMDLSTAGARHHPDLALLPGGAGALREPARCPGSARRSPASSVDPDRKKMSKSKGNVVVPDRRARRATVRTRSAGARPRPDPGMDSPFDEPR